MEYDVDWRFYEKILSDLFFRRDDSVQYGTEEYRDFWGKFILVNWFINLFIWQPCFVFH
jgi:hypothetical protein